MDFANNLLQANSLMGRTRVEDSLEDEEEPVHVKPKKGQNKIKAFEPE